MERDAYVDTSGFDDAAGGLPLFKRSLRIRALCERIEEVREHMAPGALRTSAEVVERILKPLFTQLGWDFADPRTWFPGSRPSRESSTSPCVIRRAMHGYS